MTKGLCRWENPALFHPESGGRYASNPAKRVCAECPVKQSCLEFALNHMTDEGDDPATRGVGKWGVWGGTSEKERKELSRRMTITAARVA
jgi:WhiB family redox-sensing transcriptional regulator